MTAKFICETINFHLNQVYLITVTKSHCLDFIIIINNILIKIKIKIKYYTCINCDFIEN